MNKIELILNKAFNSDIPELQNFPIETYQQLFYHFDTEDGHMFFKNIKSQEGKQLMSDVIGNFMYVRYRGPVSVDVDLGKLHHTVPLRIVAGFIDCTNTIELAEGLINVMFRYISKYITGDMEIQLNIQNILEDELNDRYSIKKDNISLFTIDFDLKIPFSNFCSLDTLICDTCEIQEEATCAGFPQIVIPNPY